MTEVIKSDDQYIAKLRRARQMAAAILIRGREAGIPKQYMRMKQSEFASILDSSFHNGPVKGVPAFASDIYSKPDFLLKRNFIVIDGGNFEARQMAGFAILFRMIAYDKRGLSITSDSLLHKFQSFNATENISRNDLAEEIKSYDLIFINEFDELRFKPHFEHGSFFDEVLTERINMGRPTIVGFVNPISSEKLTQENKEKKAMEGKLDSGCGRHLARLALIPQTTQSVLRIRVKTKEDKEI